MKRETRPIKEIQPVDREKHFLALEMYHVSGQDPITPKSFERYVAAKNQDEAIKEIAFKAEEDYPESFLEIKELARCGEINEAKALIYGILSKASEQEQVSLMGEIPNFLLGSEIGEFARFGLGHNNHKVRLAAAELVPYISSEKERIDIILGTLMQNDNDVKDVVKSFIYQLSEKSKIDLLEKVFANCGLRDKIDVSFSAYFDLPLPAREDWQPRITAILREGINSQDSAIQVSAIRKSVLAEDADRKDIIKVGLNSDNLEVFIAATIESGVSFTEDAIQNLLVKRIMDFLNGDDPVKAQKSFELMRYVNSALEQRKLFELFSNSSNPAIRAKALVIGLRYNFPFILEREAFDSVREIVINPDLDYSLKKDAIFGIRKFMSKQETIDLLNEIYVNGDERIRGFVVLVIRDAHNYIWPKERLIDFFKSLDNELQEECIQSPLYKDFPKQSGKFPKAGFEKTGSKTTLIGGELKEKAIIRQIEPKAFLTWQKLFEDYGLWQDNGFDYVPIEPIITYRLNKEDLVDVYSGVLDLNLEFWRNICGEYGAELLLKRDRIIEILRQMGVSHGHLHDRNFCLRFFRNQEGKIDFSREPRIYLIDFDQANYSF